MALAEDGFHLGLAYAEDRCGAEELARKVRATSSRATVRQMDPAGVPESAAAVDEFAQELGGIEVLVNCPGSTAVECIQRGVRYMIAGGAGGRIVNITTASAPGGRLTGLLSTELARYSITVNSVVVPDMGVDLEHSACNDREAAAVTAYLAAPAAAFVTGAAYFVDGTRLTVMPHSLVDTRDRPRPRRIARRFLTYTGRWTPGRWMR